MKRLITTVVTIAAVLSIQGCGFHLRGKVVLSDRVSPIYVKSTDLSLARTVEDQIRSSGNALAGAEGGAGAILNLRGVDYQRVVRTVDERGKVTGYTLLYSVNFDLTDKDGKKLVDDNRITQQREYNFDPNQVLAKEGEEGFLREDMERDVAQQVLRQLSTVGK